MLGAEAGRPQRNRRAGWQQLHVAIDGHARLAYAELLAGRDAASCARFLTRAVAWYAEQGIAVNALADFPLAPLAGARRLLEA